MSLNNDEGSTPKWTSLSLTNNKVKQKKTKKHGIDAEIAANSLEQHGFGINSTDHQTVENSCSNDKSSSGPLVIPLLPPSVAAAKLVSRVRKQGNRDDDTSKSPIVALLEEEQELLKSTSSTTTTTLSAQDVEAVKALEAELTSTKQEQKKSSLIISSSLSTVAHDGTIASTNSSKQRGGGGEGNNQNYTGDATSTRRNEDNESYQASIRHLPDELSTESSAYRTIPVSEFGAALLRGMGWDGSNNNEDNNDSKTDRLIVLPRPQRLGLGATPKVDPNLLQPHESSSANGINRRMKSQDAFWKEQAIQKQQLELKQLEQQRIMADPQRTLQNGSVVYMVSTSKGQVQRGGRRQHQQQQQRAKIVQLTGVPGLNMVQVRFEHDRDVCNVKRGQIGELVSRAILLDDPFQEHPSTRQINTTGGNSQNGNSTQKDATLTNRMPESVRLTSNSSRKRNREGLDRYITNKPIKEEKKSIQYSQSHPNKDNESWVMNQIRVRVVSEKLGRRYFKEKGIVIDITSKGTVTLQLSDGTVLDHVKERYLETALPKVDGNVVVLTGPSRNVRGSLLERDSLHNKGVIQIYEDMSVVTMSLDDIAEWCGPLDDDLLE